MKIKKMYQGTVPDNKILNMKSNSQTDCYSCNFMLNYCHPIGEIFITVNANFDPNVSFGGTWTRITNDAYLKIVSSNPGNLGGTSSSHKIPLSSIPSHNHWVTNKKTTYGSGYSTNYIAMGATSSPNADYWEDLYTNSVGGSGAYYPYYYGVYVWKRTA